MRALEASLLAALASLVLCQTATAQEEGPVSFTLNLGAATEYVFRGVSQTYEDPQVFGGIDAEFGSIAYAGVWATNVDFADGTDAEYDLYAGVRPAVGAITYDLGVIYYGYVGQPSGANWDYWEGKLGAAMPFGPATFAAAVYYSPEFTGETGEAWYAEVNAATTIPKSNFSLSGAIGHQTIEEMADYTTWNLGIGYAFTNNLGVDLRYYDTSRHRFGKLYDSRAAASVKAIF